VLNASANPFYVQFKDVVATALRTSIRFTNRFVGRTASLPAHEAVLLAIRAAIRSRRSKPWPASSMTCRR
jgi:DNA-binding FadR family transcriptional regulator